MNMIQRSHSTDFDRNLTSGMLHIDILQQWKYRKEKKSTAMQFVFTENGKQINNTEQFDFSFTMLDYIRTIAFNYNIIS